jgi:hypothetical protein
MDSTRGLERASRIALALQLALVAVIAGADAEEACVALLLGAGLAAAGRPLASRWPEASAMLAIGGLGMTLGWWIDLGFRSAADVAPHGAAALDTIWCRAPLARAGSGLGHLLSWMNAGMLAFGLPAMAWARRASPVDRDLCRSLGCALAMIGGMTAGSSGAAWLASPLNPATAVLCDWLGMTAGMLVGMALARAGRAELCRSRA